MKILVCFKAVYNLEKITSQELCDLRDGKLDLEVFGRKIGNYDEATLENALRIADEIREKGGEVILHAVTVGEKSERFGKDLYAFGFDKVIYLDTEEDLIYRSERTASVLWEYISKEGGYDMIFMGKQAGMGENGMTHYLLAEKLKLPCVAETEALEYTEYGIKVLSRSDNRVVQRVVKKAAIYVVGEALHPYLRSVTLREKLKAKGKEVIHIPVETSGESQNSQNFIKLVYESQEKECQIIDGETPKEKARKLWEDQLKRLVVQ